MFRWVRIAMVASWQCVKISTRNIISEYDYMVWFNALSQLCVFKRSCLWIVSSHGEWHSFGCDQKLFRWLLFLLFLSAVMCWCKCKVATWHCMPFRFWLVFWRIDLMHHNPPFKPVVTMFVHSTPFTRSQVETSSSMLNATSVASCLNWLKPWCVTCQPEPLPNSKTFTVGSIEEVVTWLGSLMVGHDLHVC